MIDAPVETVWTIIRDFNAVPEWHPAVLKSAIEDGTSSDMIGCVRNVELVGGAEVRERLVRLSDPDHSVTFAILSSPMPVDNFTPTLSLRSAPGVDRTFIESTAEFDVLLNRESEMRQVIGHQVHQAGFDALKRHFGG